MQNWVDWRVRLTSDIFRYCGKYYLRCSWNMCHTYRKSLRNNKKS
ncbi:hypothetical protein LJCM5343_11330 [Lactobacillus paragasseri]|uniref:Uncharacterized protein n=1 Tax=Lactobacillus paragasseri TaxID=2107999 RepID=A0ABQ0N0J3_9LACO|nr:hypothetical protein LpgJCM5343_05090 [Lactobacillus paragasseri]GBA79736.1 hypothetical protein LJCM1130_00630 [Lactobacillus paragasseri]GBA87112.1 hypothetical protein LJCM5343_11330 [Lactobacillus paragasseri]